MSVTTHLSPATRIDILRALAKPLLKTQSEKELEADIIAIVDEFNRLRVERSKIIHARWYGSGFSGLPLVFDVTARGELKLRVKGYTVTSVAKTVSEITAPHKRISAISRRFLIQSQNGCENS